MWYWFIREAQKARRPQPLRLEPLLQAQKSMKRSTIIHIRYANFFVPTCGGLRRHSKFTKARRFFPPPLLSRARRTYTKVLCANKELEPWEEQQQINLFPQEIDLVFSHIAKKEANAPLLPVILNLASMETIWAPSVPVCKDECRCRQNIEAGKLESQSKWRRDHAKESKGSSYATVQFLMLPQSRKRKRNRWDSSSNSNGNAAQICQTSIHVESRRSATAPLMLPSAMPAKISHRREQQHHYNNLRARLEEISTLRDNAGRVTITQTRKERKNKKQTQAQLTWPQQLTNTRTPNNKRPQ